MAKSIPTLNEALMVRMALAEVKANETVSGLVSREFPFIYKFVTHHKAEKRVASVTFPQCFSLVDLVKSRSFFSLNGRTCW
jgi:hypothetical protein